MISERYKGKLLLIHHVKQTFQRDIAERLIALGTIPNVCAEVVLQWIPFEHH